MPYSPEFEAWWKIYPNRVGKGFAFKSFAKVVGSQISLDRLMAVTANYAESVANFDKKYIPHPATWLNQSRFDDDAVVVIPAEDRWRQAREAGVDPELKSLAPVTFSVEWPDIVPHDPELKEQIKLEQWRAWMDRYHDEIVARLEAS